MRVFLARKEGGGGISSGGVIVRFWRGRRG